MKPEIFTPKFGPEQVPISYESSIEQGSKIPTPESGLETGAERHEQGVSTAIIATASDLAIVLPTPVLGNTSLANMATVSNTPMIANDDDLIEKEWVAKAKKIVAETRDDPYKREVAVNRLQKDYLSKRYGRELGSA